MINIVIYIYTLFFFQGHAGVSQSRWCWFKSDWWESSFFAGQPLVSSITTHPFIATKEIFLQVGFLAEIIPSFTSFTLLNL